MYPIRINTGSGVVLCAVFVAAMVVIATIDICPISAASADKSELLLRFQSGVREKEKQDLLDAQGLIVINEIPEIGVLLVSAPGNALAALAGNPQIEFVEENRQYFPAMIPDDPYYGLQWHLAKIGAPNAWEITTGDPSVIIAILDTGVDTGHPDLITELVQGYDFYNCTWGCPEPFNVEDYRGHGTATAGTAAAAMNNGIGVASVAGDCKIMPLKVTAPDGSTSDFYLATALVNAPHWGARVASISFNIYSGQAIGYAAQDFMEHGGLVFAAGGNSYTFVNEPDNPYIISISGTSKTDTAPCTYGPYIDLSAPYTDIYTTIRGGYGSVGGTSFAAPQAAGVAALMFSANPHLPPEAAEAILESTADDLGTPGYDYHYGWGRINASEAVAAAAAYIPPPDTKPPNVVITAPVDGAILKNSILITVNANDDVAVTKVELYKDGELLAEDLDSPYEFYWNTTLDPDGTYTLQAKAYDRANNIGGSPLISVTVQNEFTVTITNPVNGSTVEGPVEICISIASNLPIDKVTISIDDKLVSRKLRDPYTYLWNSDGGKPWIYWHTITVCVYDTEGDVATDTVSVQTIKDSEKP